MGYPDGVPDWVSVDAVGRQASGSSKRSDSTASPSAPGCPLKKVTVWQRSFLFPKSGGLTGTSPKNT